MDIKNNSNKIRSLYKRRDGGLDMRGQAGGGQMELQSSRSWEL